MITGDIQNISFRDEIESLGLRNKVDLVFGGPPCQGFSTAGKKVFDDPRNMLFTQFLRVIDEANPRMVLFENVSGFKNLYSGVVFQAL
jgi:DNA (cytosine-5)-methyltransferase 1